MSLPEKSPHLGRDQNRRMTFRPLAVGFGRFLVGQFQSRILNGNWVRTLDLGIVFSTLKLVWTTVIQFQSRIVD